MPDASSYLTVPINDGNYVPQVNDVSSVLVVTLAETGYESRNGEVTASILVPVRDNYTPIAVASSLAVNIYSQTIEPLSVSKTVIVPILEPTYKISTSKSLNVLVNETLSKSTVSNSLNVLISDSLSKATVSQSLSVYTRDADYVNKKVNQILTIWVNDYDPIKNTVTGRIVVGLRDTIDPRPKATRTLFVGIKGPIDVYTVNQFINVPLTKQNYVKIEFRYPSQERQPRGFEVVVTKKIGGIYDFDNLGSRVMPLQQVLAKDNYKTENAYNHYRFAFLPPLTRSIDAFNARIAVRAIFPNGKSEWMSSQEMIVPYGATIS